MPNPRGQRARAQRLEPIAGGHPLVTETKAAGALRWRTSRAGLNAMCRFRLSEWP